MKPSNSEQYRLLAAQQQLSDDDPLKGLDFAASRLPRSCAIGVEVTYDRDKAVRIDAIAGVSGRQFELRALKKWSRALVSDDGTRENRSASVTHDTSSIASLTDALLDALESDPNVYQHVWLESDGLESSPYAPAIVCEHRADSGLSGFDLPFGRRLAEQSPGVAARMSSVPFADKVSMIGWMPGRSRASSGAGRLYWDQRTISSLGASEAGVRGEWRIPAPLASLATSARECGLDCAVAINVTEDQWTCDGLEVAPANRGEPVAWERFDDWAEGMIPAARYWGYRLKSAFRRWDDCTPETCLPDHILGAAVALPNGSSFVPKARPSHIKLSLRGNELRVKVYAGLEYTLVSSQG